MRQLSMRRLISASHDCCSELVLAGVADCASVRLVEAGAYDALLAALLRQRLLEACKASLAALLGRLIVTRNLTITCPLLGCPNDMPLRWARVSLGVCPLLDHYLAAPATCPCVGRGVSCEVWPLLVHCPCEVWPLHMRGLPLLIHCCACGAWPLLIHYCAHAGDGHY